MGIIDQKYAKKMIEEWLKYCIPKIDDTIFDMTDTFCFDFNAYRDEVFSKLILHLWSRLLDIAGGGCEDPSVRTIAEKVIVSLFHKGISRNRFSFHRPIIALELQLDCLKYTITKDAYRVKVQPWVTHIIGENKWYVYLEAGKVADFIVEFDKVAQMANLAVDAALFNVRAECLRNEIVITSIKALYNEFLAPKGYALFNVRFHEDGIHVALQKNGSFINYVCQPDNIADTFLEISR